MKSDVTVAIASIPPRAKQLAECLASVTAQTVLPDGIIVEYDHEHEGAPATKNRALSKVTTEWVVYCDDDDTLYPNFIERHLQFAEAQHADFVYSVPFVPQIPGNSAGAHGITRDYQLFDYEELKKRSYIQSTVLVRTDLSRRKGFYKPPGSPYDDWGHVLGVVEAGGRVVHLPEVMFVWNHTGYGQPGTPGNTSGDPTRW